MDWGDTDFRYNIYTVVIILVHTGDDITEITIFAHAFFGYVNGDDRLTTRITPMSLFR